MDPIEIINNIYELRVVFPRFLETNTSNQAPYHNLWHSLCMVKFCNEGADFHGIKDREKTDLLIAALIHDYCHSQGENTDIQNVRTAIDRGWYLYEDTDIFYDLEDYDIRVGDIIRATQYPYVIPADELDLQQSIIRDADIMQSFENTWFAHTTFGLHKELKIDLKEFLPMQVDFMKNAQFNTDWGKQKSLGKKEEFIRKVEMLIDIFE